ncbi:GGDEF domain-containing protein [Cognatiyoonia koreensis]|uniref:GGDEF domain-containing protein n=1 Tax=Cognatiyoonia koreensis TaxID=364200 RepID=UPI0013F4CBE7|nr:GGDEF domain-containing protein [Cognatiyoonia koreensis]
MVGLENPERDATEQHRYINWLKAARKWVTLAAIVLVFFGLAENLLGVSLSTYTFGTDAATSPLSAFSITLLAFAISLGDRREAHAWHGSVIALFAILAVSAQRVAPLFVDHIPFGTYFVAGTVGTDTMLIICLLAVSVLMRFQTAVLGLATWLAACALILNGIIGHTYGLPYFDGEMAILTLLSLVCCLIGTLALYLHRPLVRVVFMTGSIGFRTRTMMAVGFLAPWFCGLLLYRWYGVPEREFHVEATLISAIIWTMLAVTLASGFSQERADKERRAAEKRLAEQALTDSLTGLPNRAALTARLTTYWTRFQRFNVPSAIILIDLDHFKAINDTFGHDMGDNVLRAVRGALLPYLRQDDIVARWGGEEFICVLKNTDLRQLQHISERLRAAIRAISDLPALSHGKGPVKVSASVGVSTFLAGDRGYEAAIKRADDALYVAKRHGRNRVIFDGALRPQPTRQKRFGNVLTA